MKRSPASGKWISITRNTNHTSFFNFSNQPHHQELFNSFPLIRYLANISLDSTDSDVFYVEQISNEPSPQRNNSPDISNSTEPTVPFGFGRQLPIVPPSLNDLNLPPNLFNVLATMAIANNTEDANDDNYILQSSEPSEPYPISTPPMNVSACNSWETSYTTTDNDTFYSSDEPRRIFFSTKFCIATVTAPKTEETIEPGSLGMSIPKEGGVSQRVCEACGQTIPSAKDIPSPSNRD